jgi:hypothetical protein
MRWLRFCIMMDSAQSERVRPPERDLRRCEVGADPARVRCRRGPGCAGIPARRSAALGEDSDAARRAELPAEINAAQERREEARRDYSDQVIDRADWLRHPPATEDDVAKARREYDWLTGVWHRTKRHSLLGPSTRRMESVEYRPQADRHPHRVTSGRHQAPSRRRGPQPLQQHQGQGCAPRTGNGDLAATRRIRLARFRRPQALSLLR